jgi:hypothetical protein
MSIIILVISFLLNLTGRIVVPVGLIAFLANIGMGNFDILMPMGVLGVIGIVYGILAYRYDIPPRWFWSESANSIFEYSVGAVIGYGILFALWVPFLIVLTYLIEYFG